MDKSEIEEMEEGKSSEEIDALTTEDDDKVVDDADLAEEALEATDDSSPVEKPQRRVSQMSSEDLDDLFEEEEAEKEKPEAKPDEKPEKKVSKMSSDELDELFDEDDEKADKPKEEPAKKEELSETDQQLRAKDSKIASMKHTAKELELDKVRLETELEVRKELQAEAKTQEEPKSPLDIAKEEHLAEFGDLDDFKFTVDLYEKNEVFKAEQAKVKTAKAEQAKVKTATDNTARINVESNRAAESLQSGELSETVMGKGLDLKSVSAIGDKFLSEGNLLDLKNINATKGTEAALKAAYKIMVRAIIQNGGEEAKTLALAINARKSQAKPKKEKQREVGKSEKEEVDEGEPKKEKVAITNPNLSNFLGNEDGFFNG